MLTCNMCGSRALDRFVRFKQACYSAAVRYGFGAKDPDCGSGRVDFAAIDCSGFVRTLLQYADPVTFADLPDGSYEQGDWFARAGFRPEPDYSAALLQDGHIRVWVHHPNGRGGDPTGHIWLTVNGHTVESCAGHGPHEQPAGVYAGIWDVGFLLC